MSAVPRMTVLFAAALLLAGCNADERARPVKLDKGAYKGPADTELSDATRDQLARRVAFQKFEGGLSQALRPSEPPAAGAAAIDGRVAGQRF